MVDVELAHVRSAASHDLIYSSYHSKSVAFKRQQAARYKVHIVLYKNHQRFV
ncbi:hypothetical protein P20495_4009 [Pseudoalteromonas sp. BSi20495]|nr:hypothetical protein P20495_4009 [Pseudoalteromonas sp. BSi20495]